MKEIPFLTISILLMIFVSLACATRKQEIKATTSNPDTPKTIADTILNPDFQAFLRNHESMKAAKPLDVKMPVASGESVNAVSNPTAQEIGQKIKEQKFNQM